MKYVDPSSNEFPKLPQDELVETLFFFAKLWLKETILLGYSMLEAKKKEYQRMREEITRGIFPSPNHQLRVHPAFQGLFNKLIETGVYAPSDYPSTLPANEIERMVKNQLARELDVGDFHQVQVWRLLFLHSAQHSKRYLRRLGEEIDELQAVADDFEAKTPYLTEVRHINEHFDEYIVGKGRSQEKNFVLDKRQRRMSDASGIFVEYDESTGNVEIVIGNRVYVSRVVKSAKEALLEVIKTEIGVRRKKHSL